MSTAAILSTAGGGSRVAARAPIAPAVTAPTALNPIEITLSGLDGVHGTPTSSIAPLAAPVPAAPARAATGSKAVAAAAPKAAGNEAAGKEAADATSKPAGTAAAAHTPLAEGVHVEAVTGAATSGASKTGALHAHLSASTTVLSGGLDLQSNGTSTFTVAGMRYVYANFKLRNAKTCRTPGSCQTYGAEHNVTVLAAETANTLSQTAISSIKLFDGSTPSNAATLAPQILPTDGVAGDGNGVSPTVHPEPGLESLQVFTEAEVAAVTPPTGVTLLPYGYVAKNLTNPASRALPGSPAVNEYDGGFTIALAFPTQSVATQNPFSITLTYLPVDDLNTRVTQSLEDDNQAGDLTSNARAAALGSTDLAVLGANNHVTATDHGDPICSVRTAGPASAPTAYLVQAAATDSHVASAPYNVRGLGQTTHLNTGLCQPVTADPSTIYSQFAVSGSQSGPRTQSGYYGATDVASSTGQLVLVPSSSHPFFTGEKVSFSLTAGITSTTGNHPAPFVGSYTVGGEAPSTGQFRHYSSNVTLTRPISEAVGDLDQDGIPDLVVVDKTSGTVTVSYGNGDGTFGANTIYSLGSSSTPLNVAIGDFNRDGWPDLAVTTSANNTVSVLMANPTFRGHLFNSPTTVATGAQPDGIAVGDFNDDGYPDFVATNFNSGANGTVTEATSNGDGTFSTSTATANGYAGGDAVVAGDFTGDGNLDVAVAYGTTNAVCLFKGDDNGSFTIPACATTGKDPVAIAAADLNGDGTADFVTANKTDNNLTDVVQTRSGSTITLTPNTLTDPDDTGIDGVGIGDVTGDGHPDIVVSAATTNDVTVIPGNGSGHFTVTFHYTTVTGPAGLTVADLNGDGVADVVVANVTPNLNITTGPPNTFTVFLGDGFGSTGTNLGGLGTPVAAGQHTYAVGNNPAGEAVGDFNLDGNLDVVVANTADASTAGSLTPYLGNGQGGFTKAATVSLPTGTGPADVEAADFDGDGKLDLSVTNSLTGSVTFLKGNGDGTFTTESTLTTGGDPLYSAVGDVNGDGLPDLVTSNKTGDSLTVLVNTGNFAFTTSTVDLMVNRTDPQPNGITVGDFNADGKLDLAVAYVGTGNLQLLTGDGNGGFTLAASYPLVQGASGVTSGDFNADGILDLAVADNAHDRVYVFMGQVGGTFAAPTSYLTGAGPDSVVAADVNGDGRDDLLVSNGYSNNVTELLSNGSTFSPAPDSPVAVASGPARLAVGDFLGTQKLAMALTADNLDQLDIVPQR